MPGMGRWSVGGKSPAETAIGAKFLKEDHSPDFNEEPPDVQVEKKLRLTRPINVDGQLAPNVYHAILSIPISRFYPGDNVDANDITREASLIRKVRYTLPDTPSVKASLDSMHRKLTDHGVPTFKSAHDCGRDRSEERSLGTPDREADAPKCRQIQGTTRRLEATT
ncbi:hypothetical protein K2X85_05835 [bacterium]|nr:hypothetical protein [bacterium]